MGTSVRYPIDDMRGMAGLIHKQWEHLYEVRKHVDHYGRKTDGLTGKALEWLRPVVDELANAHRDYAFRLSQGITDSAMLLDKFADDAEADDHVAAEWLRQAYPDPPGVFLELTSPGKLRPTSYAEGASPQLSDPGEVEVSIVKQLKLVNKEFAEHEEWFNEVTGESLLTFTEPLLGDWGRVNYLAVVYSQSAQALYDVAANLRLGTLRIAPVFNGAAGNAFEWHMFRWHMGIGGVGDLHLMTSYAYQGLFAGMVVILAKIVEKLLLLSRKFLSWLKGKLLKPGVKEALKLIMRGVLKKGMPYVGHILSVFEIGQLIYYGYGAIALMEEVKGLYEEMVKKIEKAQKWFNFIRWCYGHAQGMTSDPERWAHERYHQIVKIEEVVLIKRGDDGDPPEVKEQNWNPAYGFWRVAFLKGLIPA